MKNKKDEREKIGAILIALPPDRRHLVIFLHHVQQHFGYVPEEALQMAAEHFSVAPAEIYSLVTFYSAFRTTPGSELQVTVCQGTACHVRGARQLTEELDRLLRVGPEGEQPATRVSLKTVNCLGCCALAPVMVVNGRYIGRVKSDQVPEIVKEIRRKLKNE